jgi:hypothetical protein
MQNEIKKLSISVQVLLLFGLSIAAVAAAEFQILRASSGCIQGSGVSCVFSALGLKGWLVLGVALVSVLLLVIWVNHVARCLRLVTEFAEDAASARWHEEIGGIRIERQEGSQNEIHRLAFAVNALYASVKLLSFRGANPIDRGIGQGLEK